MKKFIPTILIVFASLINMQAQTPLQFTQVFKTLEFVNPAYSAFEGGLSGKLLYRSQWEGMDGAPRTTGFIGYSPLKNYKLGVGIMGVNHRRGNVLLNNVAATFNVDLQVNKTDFLAFGIQAGGEYNFVDKEHIITYYDVDATTPGGLTYNDIVEYTFLNPAFGTGLIYYNPRFYFGVSSFLMLNHNKFVAQDFYQGSFWMGGLTQNIAMDWYLKETFLYKMLHRDRNIGELGVYLLYKDLFWFGTSHRYLESQSIIMDIKLTETVRIGMSYDIQLSELKRYNYGSFEFRLEYRAFSKYRQMMNRKKTFNEF
jgi:type IX secretion system PorP/SprF family membrane protein